MKGATMADLRVGDFAEFDKTISESDMYLFAGIIGDMNPTQLKQPKTQKGMFESQIAYGMLSAGLVSVVVGMQLPGPGTIYLSQTIKFIEPIKFGDTITARAEVKERNVEKNRLVLHTTCTNQDGKLVLDGEATVMPPKA